MSNLHSFVASGLRQNGTGKPPPTHVADALALWMGRHRRTTPIAAPFTMCTSVINSGPTPKETSFTPTPSPRRKHDAVSPKAAWPQLAPARQHARACDLWRDRGLQRDLHAHRSSGRRVLA